MDPATFPKLTGCDPPLSLRVQDGSTALHYAASYGAIEALEWLVEQGGDLEARQTDGSNILHAAAGEGQAGVVEWMHRKVKLYPLGALSTSLHHSIE
jgi:ankyrin repeat protein